MSFLKKVLPKTKKTEPAEAKGRSAPPKAATENAAFLSDKFLTGVIRNAHLTEKSSAGAAEGKYAFRVSPGSNKHDIKRAVETRYKVKVEAVWVISMPSKERRRGQQIGLKPGFKKAIIQLKKGQTIEIQ